jgi:hypothetical protein
MLLFNSPSSYHPVVQLGLFKLPTAPGSTVTHQQRQRA